MSDLTRDTIALESAMERLRQETETFEQRRAQDQRWFVLRLAMGYIAVVLLPAIAGVCAFIIFNAEQFAITTVTVATTALLVDVLGLIMAVWKIVLAPAASVTVLAPVTQTPEISSAVSSVTSD
jgi:hypothetical protein